MMMINILTSIIISLYTKVFCFVILLFSHTWTKISSNEISLRGSFKRKIWLRHGIVHTKDNLDTLLSCCPCVLNRNVPLSIFLSVCELIRFKVFFLSSDQSPLQNSFTPTVVGSTADIASPLPLQRANTVCYVGDLLLCRINLLFDLLRLALTLPN
jgi:hypothetical protein